MHEQPKQPWQWRKAAMRGAWAIHLVLGLTAFFYGAVFGVAPYMPDSRQIEYGIAGGVNGLSLLLLSYVLTLGVFPLALSFAGAVVGVLAAAAWRVAPRNR